MAGLLLSVSSVWLGGLQVVLLVGLLLPEHSKEALLGGWLPLNFDILALLLTHLQATDGGLLEALPYFHGLLFGCETYQHRQSRRVMKKKIKIAVRIHRPTLWKNDSFLHTFCPCLSVVHVTLKKS
jgi:hypothetical protein